MISLQIGFFSNERAFALRYQTAGMLETVLRQGVLGEDDSGEESPKWVIVISKYNFIFWTDILLTDEVGILRSNLILSHEFGAVTAFAGVGYNTSYSPMLQLPIQIMHKMVWVRR